MEEEIKKILEILIKDPHACGFIAMECGKLEVCYGETHGHPVRDEVIVATFGGCHGYWTDYESVFPYEIFDYEVRRRCS